MVKGGKRAGAGRKPVMGVKKITTSIVITPTLKSFLDQLPGANGAAIERVFRKTKAFKEWAKANE